MTRYSKAARESFLKLFEAWEEDLAEKLTEDVSTCFRRSGSPGNYTYQSLNSQGRVAERIMADTSDTTKPAEQNVLIQLFRYSILFKNFLKSIKKKLS